MNDFQSLSILILIVQIGVASGQAYLAKRAQNKADKEDIKQITSLIESAKAEFAEKNAIVLHNLALTQDRKTKVYSESQQALIDFFRNVNSAAYKLMEINPNMTNVERMILFKSECEEFFPKINIMANMVDLLIDDDELVKQAYNLNSVASMMKFNLFKSLDGLISLGHDIEKEYSKTGLADDDAVSQMQTLVKLEKQFGADCAEMANTRMTQLQAFSKMNKEFKEMAKEYLLS